MRPIEGLYQLLNGILQAPRWWELPGPGLSPDVASPVAAVLAVVIPCLIALGLVMGVAGASTYIERKLAADIQRRIGPNQCNVGSFFGAFMRAMVKNASDSRAGVFSKLMGLGSKLLLPLVDVVDKIVLKLAPGAVIFMADGLKLILKEDIVPDAVDKPLFKLAPAIVLASAFGALVALPYSSAWYVADFNIGIFFIAAITSLEVLGILMSGWASNNKWSLLGGMRSAAQIVSYELPVGLAIATGMLVCGTMSMQGMVYDQLGISANGGVWETWPRQWWLNGWFFQWNVFHPVMFILAPIYFLAALAECNRTPFDIPEAESELVSGYHTEYSGMRFAFFFLAEYTMMIVVCGIAVTLFLGGWSTGIAPLERVLTTGFDANKLPVFNVWGTIIHLAAFGAKTYLLILLMMWIRWTIPRFRVDQMMTLCWKKLIPLGLMCFLAMAVWMLVRMGLAKKFGEQTIAQATFVLRAVFAVSVLAWLVWYFKKPMTPQEKTQREVIARANLSVSPAK
ncbi:MAG TPA: complex I subunit 1 family protein [Planctomycetota bacterium]|jgi:NADH-quinone oxidoreductase subunit H